MTVLRHLCRTTLLRKRTHIPSSWLRLEKQGGVARARNQLINHAHGEIILFLDSDCVLCDPQWIEKHVRFHQNPLVLFKNKRRGLFCIA